MKEFDRNSRVVALGLTELQKSFAERYIEHFNGSRAVRESGSEASQPSVVAMEWPNNPTHPSAKSRNHTGCRTEPVMELVATTVRTILSDVTTVPVVSTRRMQWRSNTGHKIPKRRKQMRSIKRTLRVWSKTYGNGVCLLPGCGIEFAKRSKTQKFCSPSHKWKAWDCAHPRLKKVNHDGIGTITRCRCGETGTCIQREIGKCPPTLPLAAD